MKKFRFFLLSSVAVISFGPLSCQSSNDTVAIEASQSNSDVVASLGVSNYNIADDGAFSIVKDQFSNALRGDFKFDGKKIKLETYRGEKIGIMKELNPSFPEYEIDVRLLDKNGFPFFIQVGGHGPANKDWVSPLGVDLTKSKEEVRVSAQESFALAKKMINSLEKIKFKDEFNPEYEAITGIKSILESSGGSGLAKTNSGTVTHIIEIWKKQAFFPGDIIGDHSGTIFKIFDNFVVYQIWCAANHGTAPGAPNMSLSCSATFGNRQGLSEAPPMCATSFGIFSGQHICNDDTYIQYQRIRDNINPSTTGGTCSDNTFRRYAPSCW